MSASWSANVETYIDQLGEIAKSIDSILAETQVETTQVDAHKVDQSTARLQQALVRLEEKIAQREDLLKAPDAPQRGISLTEKLRSTRNSDDTRLAHRCDEVAALIASINDRAIALFVCQFHLAECSGDIMRLMTGTTPPATYEPSQRTPQATRGGLFNESA